MEKMLAKLSTRRYKSGLEPVGERVEARASSTSRSAVSRRFVEATEHALAELLPVPLGARLVALMVDGVHFGDHVCVVAMGIDLTGRKTRSRSQKATPRTPPSSRTSSSGFAIADSR